MHPITLALLVNSALYIAGVFVAGLVWGDREAVILAIATAALCYLSPLMQAWSPQTPWMNTLLVIASILAGAAAGVLLVT